MTDLGLKHFMRDDRLDPKPEDFPPVEEVVRLGSHRRRRSALVWSSVAVVAVLVLVAAAASALSPTNQGDIQGRPSASIHPSPHRMTPGAVGYGPVWSAMDPPFGREATLEEARSEAGYPLYTPNTSIASEASITHVWLGTEPPGGKDMLPEHAQTNVAIAYSSGVQVTYVPWVYGIHVPPFSQSRNEAAYEIAATQNNYTSVSTIDGVPVRIESSGSDSGPDSIEFNLGTNNADALTIVVMGKVSDNDLSDVSSSIIQAWQAANPG